MDDSGTFSVLSKDGTKLHGYIWPAKAPRAAVSLVHGFGEHAGRYAGLAAHLNEQGYSVVAADLRGHGHSEGKRGVVRKYTELQADRAALMNKTRSLFPKLPHFLYGHSMGGGIVLDYARNPEPDMRAVITTGPLIALAEPPPAFFVGIMRGLSKLAPRFVLRQPIDGTKISTLTEEQLAYTSDPLNHGQMSVALAAGMVDAGARISAAAKAWSVPVLLMHAENDRLTDCQASANFAAHAPNVDFVPLARAEHEIHNDITRTEVYRRTCDFIESHLP